MENSIDNFDLCENNNLGVDSFLNQIENYMITNNINDFAPILENIHFFINGIMNKWAIEYLIGSNATWDDFKKDFKDESLSILLLKIDHQFID